LFINIANSNSDDDNNKKKEKKKKSRMKNLWKSKKEANEK